MSEFMQAEFWQAEFWQEWPRYVALAAGVVLIGWGIWCTLSWAKGDWQRLRRWFARE